MAMIDRDATPDPRRVRTSATERRRRPDRRAALLKAALELFTACPYEDVSVDDICERAKVAHGLLSYHFGGKRQLFAAAVSHAWDELIAYERPLDSEVTVVDRFHGYLFRHFDYFRVHPQRFRLMTRSGHGDEHMSDVLRAARRRAVREIEDSLGCPEGAPAALRTAISGWAGYVDTVTLEYIENPELDIDAIVDMCAQVLVASVRSASGVRLDSVTELEALSRVVGLQQGAGDGRGSGDRSVSA